MARTTRTALAALTMLGALAACGGDSTSPTPPAAVTRRLDIVPAAGTLEGLNGKTLSLAPGDTARLSGVLNDSNGSSTPAAGLTWTPANTAIAAVDANGLLRAQANGTTTVIARSAQYADTLSVVVSACGTAATINLAVGQVQSFGAGQGASLCVPTGAAGAEFTIVAYNGDSADLARGGSVARPKSASINVAGSGLAALATAASLAPAEPSLSRAVAPSLGGASATSGEIERLRDASFDRRLRETARQVLTPRMAAAARTQSAQGTGTPGLRRSVAALAAPVIGELVRLNAGSLTKACDTLDAKYRTGRIVAIGQKAIIVADTLNPAGGFTTTEYQNYAAAFDTLVHPVDVANFGAESDVDKNSKSVIFFTSAVNAMTPVSADYYVGGFFYERDLFQNTTPRNTDYCAASNYAEMFYMLVPDPSGTINSNRFTKAFVDGVTIGTLAHEFQHLINSGRRLYTNQAPDWEDTWLNEGLAHVAEELVFYKATGTAPRARLDAPGIRATTGVRTGFNAYQNGNFGRLISFLKKSDTSSPYADDDDLETRGAAWQFLRYAADRVNGNDATLWQKLVASTKLAGMQNLRTALGLTPATLTDWFSDWTVANYADGLVASLDPRYAYRSWNFRSVVGSYADQAGRLTYPTYPIVSRTLQGTGAQVATIRGGAAAYFRFAVPANSQARVTAAGTGNTLPSTVRIAVVRVK